MKAPTARQLEALRHRRNDRELVGYLIAALEDYRDQLEFHEGPALQKAQGSAHVLRELLGHINS